MRLANERTLVIALIETKAGIDHADEILAVPGIDVGWLGHFDLSNSLGITGQFEHPELLAATETLLAACKRHGKAPGFLAGSIPTAQAWLRKGVRCLCYGTDIAVFQDALATALTTLRGR
jgi:2-keto-3-deoxy-L-rhamnonate aldolase RhmA